MSFAKMKFFIATILLAACAAVQGRSVQVHPITSMVDHGMGIDSRIIDGRLAAKGQIPWQAALIFPRPDGFGLCGGSLISNTVILTAAHCLYGKNQVEVHLGGVNLWSDMEYNQTSYKFIIHEKYNSHFLENDVALIILPVPVTITDNVKIIPLPRRSYPDLVGKTLRVSGYGKTLTSQYSELLQFVDLIAIDNAVCESYFAGPVFPTTLCAHGSPIHSTCQGDSGGPLVHYDYNPVLVGVFSFVDTRGCGLGYPSGYARVTSFLDWINANTGIPIRD